LFGGSGNGRIPVPLIFSSVTINLWGKNSYCFSYEKLAGDRETLIWNEKEDKGSEKAAGKKRGRGREGEGEGGKSTHNQPARQLRVRVSGQHECLLPSRSLPFLGAAGPGPCRNVCIFLHDNDQNSIIVKRNSRQEALPKYLACLSCGRGGGGRSCPVNPTGGIFDLLCPGFRHLNGTITEGIPNLTFR